MSIFKLILINNYYNFQTIISMYYHRQLTIILDLHSSLDLVNTFG